MYICESPGLLAGLFVFDGVCIRQRWRTVRWRRSAGLQIPDPLGESRRPGDQPFKF
jgi:hypothetical protein